MFASNYLYAIGRRLSDFLKIRKSRTGLASKLRSAEHAPYPYRDVETFWNATRRPSDRRAILQSIRRYRWAGLVPDRNFSFIWFEKSEYCYRGTWISSHSRHVCVWFGSVLHEKLPGEIEKKRLATRKDKGGSTYTLLSNFLYLGSSKLKGGTNIALNFWASTLGTIAFFQLQNITFLETP